MTTKEGYEDREMVLAGGFLESNGTHPTKPVVRANELPRAKGLPLEKGAGKGRKTKLAALGLSPAIIKAGDPDYAKALYQANKYRKVRMRELASLHGHVSAGAGALLASASLALAASRFLYQRAATDGDSHLLKEACRLSDQAQRHELAAWELSARESVLSRKKAASDAGQPWLLTATGEEPKKEGRKTNLQRNEREQEYEAQGAQLSGRDTQSWYSKG